MVPFLRPEYERHLPKISGAGRQARIPAGTAGEVPRHSDGTLSDRRFGRLCPGHADSGKAVLPADSAHGRCLGHQAKDARNIRLRRKGREKIHAKGHGRLGGFRCGISRGCIHGYDQECPAGEGISGRELSGKNHTGRSGSPFFH